MGPMIKRKTQWRAQNSNECRHPIFHTCFESGRKNVNCCVYVAQLMKWEQEFINKHSPKCNASTESSCKLLNTTFSTFVSLLHTFCFDNCNGAEKKNCWIVIKRFFSYVVNCWLLLWTRRFSSNHVAALHVRACSSSVFDLIHGHQSLSQMSPHPFESNLCSFDWCVGTRLLTEYS